MPGHDISSRTGVFNPLNNGPAIICSGTTSKMDSRRAICWSYTQIGGGGSFHTLASFIISIGQIWGDCRLRDLLADAAFYAPNTVDQILAGKQFNEAVRALTLAYEAFAKLC